MCMQLYITKKLILTVLVEGKVATTTPFTALFLILVQRAGLLYKLACVLTSIMFTLLRIGGD